ncbi:glucan 1,4-alpha-glucosidase [Rheinheimera texasensis]|uniref:glucan 1,4-alpha-glucosidase n=1 Tax=Rheinheimera texasensis TaxID=306205 RepID=UPI0032B14827
MKAVFRLSALSAAFMLSACQPQQDPAAATAPGAPGQPSTWSYAGKTGIGTSYEQYQDGRYADSASTGVVSKVWFSLAQGILTETMAGLIHEAQLRELQLVVQGQGFVDEEKTATNSQTDYLHKDAAGRPLALSYRVTNTAKNGQYEIEKQYFTDPTAQTMVVRTKFKALADGLTVYSYIDPALANTGSNDSATIKDGMLQAQDGNSSLTLLTAPAPVQATVGFVGVSDGLTELKTSGKVPTYHSTGEATGNVAALLTHATLKKGETASWDQVIGFGSDAAQSQAQAQQTLQRGLDTVLTHYQGDGDAIGWQDYLAQLPALAKLTDQSTDQGKLLYASALVLKAQEDKTHAGAFIASLSNPWGEAKSAEQTQTGYKAVWPRDFYQVAMALLALGDKESPKVAFQYLQKVQVTDKTPGYSGTPGWFLQKTHVDGTLEWVGIQMDQTAMPVMLGWRLWQDGVLSDAEITSWYHSMLKPAADFLAHGGKVKLDWNDIDLKSPATQQERWEEQYGYSPSTMAAIISGLVSAADIAAKAGDSANATLYQQKADEFAGKLEALTYTEQGQLKTANSDGKYYLRINSNEDPNDNSVLELRNGQADTREGHVVDGGFLELVRYGVRKADHPAVLATLGEMDDLTLPDLTRVRYEFKTTSGQTVSGWRRYGIDGYGEDIVSGEAYANGPGQTNTAGQRGRVWPFFSGERGHYELARALLQKTQLGEAELAPLRTQYVGAMEHFANAGLMLPEQVFDGVGNNSHYQYQPGEGTNGATPLAWTHAEYIKLLRSLQDQKVWDRYPLVEQRYAK